MTQPEVKPGCVLRRANIGLLEKKKLVTDKEVTQASCTVLQHCLLDHEYITNLMDCVHTADCDAAPGVQVGACTKSMNTFGFVGDLNRSPEVSCVYHSEDGENQFLRDPKRSVSAIPLAPSLQLMHRPENA